MNDTRLAELREKYQDRNLMEELAWGTYASHSGYVNKANGEFINWLCNSAYRELKKSDFIDREDEPQTEREGE